jgi:hypothetical protein
MSSEYVLAVDSSTSVGWITLARIEDGNKVEILSEQSIKAFSHAEALLPGIHSVLQENRLSPAALGLVVFGDGPGSFTGLRIGASVVSGLAFGTSVRVVAVASHAGIASAYVRCVMPLSGSSAPLKVRVFSEGGDILRASTFQFHPSSTQLFRCELLELMGAVDLDRVSCSSNTIMLGTEGLWKGRDPLPGTEGMVVKPETLPISSGLILALYGVGNDSVDDDSVDDDSVGSGSPFIRGQLQVDFQRFISDATDGCNIRYGQPVKAMTLLQRRGW